MTVQKAYKLLLLISLISFFSCEKEDIEITDYDIVSMIEKRKSVTPYFQNCSLPDSVDTLRILAIGNSYTEDGTAYIQEIMDGLDVNPNKYCVYSVGDFSYREYDYEDNETWNSCFNKNQEFLSNKFYSKESIDCFKEYYDNYYSKDEEDLEKLEVCEQKYDNSIIVVDGEDIIKGIEEGCYESAALK